MGGGSSKRKNTRIVPNTKNPFFDSWETLQRPLVLGHRGGVSLQFQENTLAAFKHSFSLGIEGAELDIILSKDKKLVIFHDVDTERLLGVPGTIHERTWEEISKLRYQKRIDINGKGEHFVEYESEQPVPLLEDVLREFKGKKYLFDIEMKVRKLEFQWRETGTILAKLLRELGMENQVVVSSFDFFMLYELTKEYPALNSGFQYDPSMAKGIRDANQWFEMTPEVKPDQEIFHRHIENFPRFLLEANLVGKATKSTTAKFDYTVVDEDTVEKFHARAMAVGIYTIFPIVVQASKPLTEEEELRVVDHLVGKKVDWFVTDEPIKLKKHLTSNKS